LGKKDSSGLLSGRPSLKKKKKGPCPGLLYYKGKKPTKKDIKTQDMGNAVWKREGP